ncbi:MAG: hypothetical protein ACRCT6_02770 [Notoacmeibacter sp.]
MSATITTLRPVKCPEPVWHLIDVAGEDGPELMGGYSCEESPEVLFVDRYAAIEHWKSKHENL